MKKGSLLIGCLALLGGGCQLTPDEPFECQPVKAVRVEDRCVSGYAGLTLIAEGFEIERPSQFTFHVFPQKDTLSNETTESKTHIEVGSERVLVSDTVIKDAPKIVVRVSMNCNGRQFESLFFPLVRKKTANPGCDVWILQKM